MVIFLAISFAVNFESSVQKATMSEIMSCVNLEFGLVATPLHSPAFHLSGRLSISSRNLRGFDLKTVTWE